MMKEFWINQTESNDKLAPRPLRVYYTVIIQNHESQICFATFLNSTQMSSWFLHKTNLYCQVTARKINIILLPLIQGDFTKCK